MKAVLPTLREKKRYLVFQLVTDAHKSSEDVYRAINGAFQSFMGDLLLAKASPQIMQENYNPKTMKGIIRVNRAYLDYARASLALAGNIAGQPAVISSVYVSGTLKSAKEHL